jgi:hypothetical protein
MTATDPGAADIDAAQVEGSVHSHQTAPSFVGSLQGLQQLHGNFMEAPFTSRSMDTGSMMSVLEPEADAGLASMVHQLSQPPPLISARSAVTGVTVSSLASYFDSASNVGVDLDVELGAMMRRLQDPDGTAAPGDQDRGPANLSTQEIQALPTVLFDKAEAQNCAICLEAFAQGEVLNRLCCGHCFHVACLSGWMQRATNCPLCRDRSRQGVNEVAPEIE